MNMMDEPDLQAQRSQICKLEEELKKYKNE